MIDLSGDELLLFEAGYFRGTPGFFRHIIPFRTQAIYRRVLPLARYFTTRIRIQCVEGGHNHAVLRFNMYRWDHLTLKAFDLTRSRATAIILIVGIAASVPRLGGDCLTELSVPCRYLEGGEWTEITIAWRRPVAHRWFFTRRGQPSARPSQADADPEELATLPFSRRIPVCSLSESYRS